MYIFKYLATRVATIAVQSTGSLNVAKLFTIRHDSTSLQPGDRSRSLPNRADEAGALQFLHKAGIHKLLGFAAFCSWVALRNQA
jgi:hypothetical protein